MSSASDHNPSSQTMSPYKQYFQFSFPLTRKNILPVFKRYLFSSPTEEFYEIDDLWYPNQVLAKSLHFNSERDDLLSQKEVFPEELKSTEQPPYKHHQL